MPEYAYKMFNKDLTCTLGRGTYQYREGVWLEEKQANCRKNGFHCAKNPLDCLTYYGVWDQAVCYRVEIGGDIDEDGYDSKISCTRIRLDKELALPQFVCHALLYMMQHPEMPDNPLVDEERSVAGRNHFAIARGKSPMAKGQIGDMLGILQEEPDTRKAEMMGAYLIEGHKYLPDTWYNARGEAVPDA